MTSFRSLSYKGYLASDNAKIPKETKRRRLQATARLSDGDKVQATTTNTSSSEYHGDFQDDEVHADNFSDDEEADDEHIDTSDPADSDYIEGGDKTIYGNSAVTRGQLFTLVYAFILRHCCTEAAISDLIALFNSIIPGCLPHSKYLFRKSLNKRMSDSVETHAYCSTCGAYLSKVGCDSVIVTCPECDIQVSCNEMVKMGHSFLLYPLKLQLQMLLENATVSEKLLACKGDCDIGGGTEYKNLKINLPDTISLTCNTDGVPLFSSSNSSLWPVYFIINELPLKMRLVHMMLSALWSGQSKPRMETLFAPIVTELQTLHDIGFQWLYRGNRVNTKVILCLFSCDSVARPCLQNVKQFNGEHGCGFCVHPGTVVSKGKGSVRVFVESASKPSERTNDETLQHAELAIANGHAVFGVKGPSILSLIPQFDIIRGFFPDYMHSVLLGVVRQFMSLWFDPSSHSKPYYLGHHVRNIDALLLAIKPPSEIKRLPRSVTSRKYWKASEYRNFLLFYSSMCLQDFLPKKFLNHWYLLIFAIHGLMAKCAGKQTIELCDLALHKFVVLVQELYGDEYVSYNVHLMTHLACSVERWGPLWANSAFLFEDANGKLLTFFHGSRGVLPQIFRSFIGATFVRELTARYIDGYFVGLLDKLSTMAGYCQSAVRITDAIVALGQPTRRILTPVESIAVSKLFTPAHMVTHDITAYQRVIVNGKLLHTENYSSSVRNSDCCFGVKSKHGAFVLQSCGTVNICHGASCDVHSIQQVFVLIANFLSTSMSYHAYDQDVGSNLLDHFTRGNIEPNRLLAFNGSDFAQKFFMCSDSKRHTVVIKLPQFELD